jgi:hypothetical protein
LKDCPDVEGQDGNSEVEPKRCSREIISKATKEDFKGSGWVF